jgi:hypothetical protein
LRRLQATDGGPESEPRSTPSDPVQLKVASETVLFPLLLL